MNDVKHRVFLLLEPAETGDWASKGVDAMLIALILANAVVAVVETVPGVPGRFARPLFWFETGSIAVFTLEYLLRVWSCTSTGASALIGRLRYLTRPLLLIDLLAILPFFLAFLGLDLRMVRIARILRFIRIAKLGRYSRAVRMLGRAVRSAKEELLMALLLGAFALVLSATLIFYAEHEAQPEKFSSIPASFWWGITTLTTVGYGDAFPITVLGKFFGGISQLIGVGLFALPTGILASAFMTEMGNRDQEPKLCPHCGGALHG